VFPKKLEKMEFSAENVEMVNTLYSVGQYVSIFVTPGA